MFLRPEVFLAAVSQNRHRDACLSQPAGVGSASKGEALSGTKNATLEHGAQHLKGASLGFRLTVISVQAAFPS